MQVKDGEGKEVSRKAWMSPLMESFLLIAGSNPVGTASLDSLMIFHQVVFVLRKQALSQSPFLRIHSPIIE